MLNHLQHYKNNKLPVLVSMLTAPIITQQTEDVSYGRKYSIKLVTGQIFVGQAEKLTD